MREYRASPLADKSTVGFYKRARYCHACWRWYFTAEVSEDVLDKLMKELRQANAQIADLEQQVKKRDRTLSSIRMSAQWIDRRANQFSPQPKSTQSVAGAIEAKG